MDSIICNIFCEKNRGRGYGPFGWAVPKPPLGRSAPLPRLPGGGPHFSREMGRKRAGAAPLDPGFYGPLAAARSFWGLCHIVPVAGLLRYPCTCPDLETFYHKNAFSAYFLLENASQIGLRIPEEIAPRTDQGQQPPKRASGNERALKKGGGGGPPPATLCVRAFSRESLDPPPGTGRGTTSQVWACAGPKPDHLPGALPRPGPGGEPRCRSGPALVLTEPP